MRIYLVLLGMIIFKLSDAQISKHATNYSLSFYPGLEYQKAFQFEAAYQYYLHKRIQPGIGFDFTFLSPHDSTTIFNGFEHEYGTVFNFGYYMTCNIMVVCAKEEQMVGFFIKPKIGISHAMNSLTTYSRTDPTTFRQESRKHVSYSKPYYELDLGFQDVESMYGLALTFKAIDTSGLFSGLSGYDSGYSLLIGARLTLILSLDKYKSDPVKKRERRAKRKAYQEQLKGHQP